MRKPVLATLVGTALLAGCAVGPDYRRPEMELPQIWPTAAPDAKAIDTIANRSPSPLSEPYGQFSRIRLSSSQALPHRD